MLLKSDLRRRWLTRMVVFSMKGGVEKRRTMDNGRVLFVMSGMRGCLVKTGAFYCFLIIHYSFFIVRYSLLFTLA